MESGLSVTPTINSGDMAAIMMVAIPALEKRTAKLKNKKAGIRELREKIAQLEPAENGDRGTNVQASAFREYRRSVGNFGSKVQVPTAVACGLRGKFG
jgi:hypothetical protein